MNDPYTKGSGLNRRAALIDLARAGTALGAGLFTPGIAPAHDALGPVKPALPAPGLLLTLHNGQRRPLPQLLQGRTTALQLMFTTCSATCPLQGAVFAQLQALVNTPQATGPKTLPPPHPPQLLSVSIDPLSDDAPALAAWRARFGAGERWLAAAPPVAMADRLLDFVSGRQAGPDGHTPQTYLFDARGRLVYRCAELASPRDIASAMAVVARSG